MGEVLSSPLEGLALPAGPHKVYPELVAEQGISGLCTQLFNNLSPSFSAFARLILLLIRFDRLFCPRLDGVSGGDPSRVWAEGGGIGRDHSGVSQHSQGD